jgi:hypothetical protein
MGSGAPVLTVNTLSIKLDGITPSISLVLSESQLRAEGVEVLSADVARLSPLVPKHIHFQGRYSFALAEAVAQRALRPLHDPDELEE